MLCIPNYKNNIITNNLSRARYILIDLYPLSSYIIYLFIFFFYPSTVIITDMQRYNYYTAANESRYPI